MPEWSGLGHSALRTPHLNDDRRTHPRRPAEPARGRVRSAPACGRARTTWPASSASRCWPRVSPTPRRWARGTPARTTRSASAARFRSPSACPACSPSASRTRRKTDREHLRRAEEQIRAGRVVALKGYLGYLHHFPNDPGYRPVLRTGREVQAAGLLPHRRHLLAATRS